MLIAHPVIKSESASSWILDDACSRNSAKSHDLCRDVFYRVLEACGLQTVLF